MLKQGFRLLTTAAASVMLVVLSSCSVMGGGGGSGNGDSSDGGFTNITNQIATWDMCKVLSIDSVYEHTNAVGYISDPAHIGLGSASNSEAISCSAMLESPLSDQDRNVSYDALLSVFPGKSTEHVDDMWEIRQGGFFRDAVQGNPYDMTESDLVIDKDLEGPWDQ